MTWLGYEINWDNPNKEEYNSELVYYCKNCLSLLVVQEIEGIDSCNKCNGVDIGQCSIQQWE